MSDLVQRNELFPAPKTAQEAFQLANTLSESKLIPLAFQKKPNDVFVAMMWSANLGVPFLQGIQGIAVINNKPSIYGDLGLAICMNSGLMESFKEEIIEQNEMARTRDGKASAIKNIIARCTIRRKGIADAFVSEFSVEDALRAGLWGKQGPWTQYPKRMLQMRARAFALRNAFPDRLMGMAFAEEMQDVIDVSETGEVTVSPAPARKMPARKTKTQKAPEPEKVEQPAAIENNPTSDDLFAQQIMQPAADPEPVDSPVEHKAIVEPVMKEVAKAQTSAPDQNELAMQRADIATALDSMHTWEEVRNFWNQIKPEMQAHCKDLFRDKRQALGVVNPKVDKE